MQMNDTIEIGRIQYKEFHPIFVIRRLNRTFRPDRRALIVAFDHRLSDGPI